MMMPANFSAISENEMTYVNGGASLSEILAPELKLENWQKFNQNMVTIIGNSFLGSYVSNTVGSERWPAYRRLCCCHLQPGYRQRQERSAQPL